MGTREVIPNVGFNNLRIGMTEKEVLEIVGGPRRTQTENAVLSFCFHENGSIETEAIADDDKRVIWSRCYFDGYVCVFQNGVLVCISIEPKPSLTMEGEKLPFTLFELVRFLKQRSRLNVRFPFVGGYVFYDLGVVVYSHLEKDILAGKEVSDSTNRIAVGDPANTRNYLKYFYRVESKREAPQNPMERFLQTMGLEIDHCTNLSEDELDAYLNQADEKLLIDHSSSGDLGYIAGMMPTQNDIYEI